MPPRRDQERALVGAALLDPRIARLLLAEVNQDEIEDPTCLAVLWALRQPQAEDYADLDALWGVAEGYMPPFRVVETVATLLGMPEDVAALVNDRPELRKALAAGRAAAEAIAPVEDEPMVILMRALFDGEPA